MKANGYWQKTLRLTLGLLLIWIANTFVIVR